MVLSHVFSGFLPDWVPTVEPYAEVISIQGEFHSLTFAFGIDALALYHNSPSLALTFFNVWEIVSLRCIWHDNSVFHPLGIKKDA